MNVCLGTNEARFPSNLSPSHRLGNGRCLSKAYNKSSLNRKKFVHKYFSSRGQLLLAGCLLLRRKQILTFLLSCAVKFKIVYNLGQTKLFRIKKVSVNFIM